jgi:AraC-like DNA-binding protein
MSFLTVLTRESLTDQAAWTRFGVRHLVVRTSSWDRLLWLVRERPVTGVVLDSAALPARKDPERAVIDLDRQFPSTATVLLARPGVSRQVLFRLGRAGLRGLVLLPLEDLASELGRSTARAFAASTEAIVTRLVSGRLPRREATAIRMALDGVQSGWEAGDFADRVGLTRAHLSVRLKSVGLPSAGHLLIWAKLLHAGRWLTDPGRTAESVSRQLEYSSGAAFRRVLHNYVGMTPTEVIQRGGLRPVLDRFLDACNLGHRPRPGRSVA